AEDAIGVCPVTGVQTCALPISMTLAVSPILLLKGETASGIGIHSVSVQDFEPGVGYTARGARGVSASAFEAAALGAIKPGCIPRSEERRVGERGEYQGGADD